MKKLTVTLLLTFAIIGFGKAQSSTEGASYLGDMTDCFQDLNKETWKYLKAVTKGKGARKVEKKRLKLLDQIKKSKNKAKKTGEFNGDATLNQAVVEYLDLSYTVLKEDFDKILDMEEIAEQSYDLMEAYLLAKEKANQKLNDASDKLIDSQKKFADTYGITLVEGEGDRVSKKINKANEALKYYNKVYLIFFKCYKQEAYALDALNRSDVNALQQNSSALVEFAEEGKQKLKEVGNFKGDNRLNTGAQKMLQFYKDEGENKFSAMVDFYVKKDNYEKVKQMVESKKEKDRTQKDIDQYNKAVNEYNEASNKFNQINENLNNQRAKGFEDWNKAVDSFFDSHS